jgi:trehalose-6-phosphate synthase
MKAHAHIRREIIDVVVVATTRVQKPEFKDHELQQLCAYVQHICVQIAKKDFM